MKNKEDLKLPPIFEQYKEKIVQTIKPYIEISGEIQPTLPWESKFRGTPYMPSGFEYPKSSNGQPMVLLAQINYSEVPHIEPFPKKGILQFYVPKEDDTFGINWDNLTNQEDFKVLYFPDVTMETSKLVTDFSFIGEVDKFELPIEKESRLSFNVKYSPITGDDFRFERVIGKSLNNLIEEALEDEDIIEDEDTLYSIFSYAGHKMGGYPFFTQYDRRECKYEEHKILLLQIDTDDSLGIIWGDVGIGNLFIKEEDLRNLDFSNVLYTWDCC